MWRIFLILLYCPICPLDSNLYYNFFCDLLENLHILCLFYWNLLNLTVFISYCYCFFRIILLCHWFLPCLSNTLKIQCWQQHYNHQQHVGKDAKSCQMQNSFTSYFAFTNFHVFDILTSYLDSYSKNGKNFPPFLEDSLNLICLQVFFWITLANVPPCHVAFTLLYIIWILKKKFWHKEIILKCVIFLDSNLKFAQYHAVWKGSFH